MNYKLCFSDNDYDEDRKAHLSPFRRAVIVVCDLCFKIYLIQLCNLVD